MWSPKGKVWNSEIKQDATLSQGQPRDAPYNECTNPNPATNLIPVHNLQ